MSLPERLGRLRRVERLGVGGFASVWRYRDEDLDSDVAVKALADNWSQRLDVRERFLEEARILRRADHDHVVRVHELGETQDGTPYFVMTYADLGTLADRLGEDERLDPATTAELVRQAALGLGQLHDLGIIHRDVKPQNLLLASSVGGTTRLMVADLGLAKATMHASGLTQVVGTPAYMAPEQVSGVGLSPAADTHALGAVAYRMLTGRVARSGGLHDLVDPAPVAAVSTYADVPARVDEILARALDPDPAARWADVRDFAHDLAAALATSEQDVAADARGPVGAALILMALAVATATFVLAYVAMTLVRR